MFGKWMIICLYSILFLEIEKIEVLVTANQYLFRV